MAREAKATETFVVHFVNQKSGQSKESFKRLGVLTCRRNYKNAPDESWVQLVPGGHLKSLVDPANEQYANVEFHGSVPPWGHIDYKG